MYMWVLRLIIYVGFVLFSSSVQATSLLLSNVPETIAVDDSFTVTASFSGSKSSCGSKTYLLRSVLFKNSGDDLFGLTKNNQDEWTIVTESPSKFFSFTTSEEGTWSGQLSIKGDHSASGFKGQGIYQLRLDRYTQTGTSKTESSNIIPISLLYTPPPTPTPSASSGPTTTPRPTATPTPSTSSGPTTTPTPTATPLASFHPTPTPMFSPTSFPEMVTEMATLSSSPSSEKVLGVSNEIAPKTPSRIVPGLIVFGGLCIVAGGLSLGTAYLEKNPE